MKNIIVANWKMNQDFATISSWINDFFYKICDDKNFPEIAICPPYLYLDMLSKVINKNNKNSLISLGSQDISFSQSGAYTGDISAKMLKDFSCKYAIIGHSERRQFHCETNDILEKKLKMTIAEDIVPIFCIGESLKDRQEKTYVDFLKSQIKSVIPKDIYLESLVLAYEPIWSIGTDTTPKISAIKEVADLVCSELLNYKNIKNFKIIYGGSVKSSNSKEILSIKNINGLLVGSASLNYKEFFKIIS
jgi:triosephosphate isomerase